MSDALSRPSSGAGERASVGDGRVLVVDCGAQYAQLIARRVREAGVYSEIVPHTLGVAEIIARRPSAVILSGGPSSVYEARAPKIDPELFGAGIPVLGICYGFQAMAQALGGAVARTDVAEFGRTEVTMEGGSELLDQDTTQVVWMSHRDSVSSLPAGFIVTARSPGASIAAFENPHEKLHGIQWHPEVSHTPGGQRLLERFLHDIAGIRPTWTTKNIIRDALDAITRIVGDQPVLCALSGGVDSAVAAALVHQAVGDRLHCIFVDHGLLRKGEAEQVVRDLAGIGITRITRVQAGEEFLATLEHVTDPEEKRKRIGAQFIRVFDREAREIFREHHTQFLVQGTLYPDVVESGGGEGAANIKSHHNVGGLPEDLPFTLVEPLRNLFKDEVRAIGTELGLPERLVWRQPFPGPGLAIRILGAVTKERLEILREADAIVREELSAAGLDRQIWQCPVILLSDVRSVGVQGDARSYSHPIVIRPVTSDDAMTADWARIPDDVLATISNRITNEVPEINRVVLDVTSKPPASIEWE